MSEDILVKAEDGTGIVDIPVPSPLEGTSQSIGDTGSNKGEVDQDALDEQTMASDGVVVGKDDQEDATEYAHEPDPIANEVMEDQSFWTGFFGAPNKPTIS
jgi:hypothetical protein